MSIIDIINNCKSHKINFQDEWNKSSLEHIDKKIKDNIEYIDLKLSLFNNGVHYEDIKQGNIGNCYLLAAISALTRYPEKIKNFFNLDGIEYGIIGVWFNYESKKNLVIIDKYLPCINRNPIFSYSFGESWIMYIEKAWSKLHGNYKNTSGGNTNDVLKYLLNGVSETLDFNDENIKKEYYNNNLWHKIFRYFNNGFILTVSDIINDNIGLVDDHAYSILDIKEINRIKLLKIHNPWGHFEWNGKWSDNDQISWTNEMKDKLNFKNKNNGCFWIEWNDFFKNFRNLYIFKEKSDENKYNISGYWIENKTCGGISENWIYNPKYKINFFSNNNEKINLSMNLSQKDTRINGNGNWKYIYLDIIQNTKNEILRSRNSNNILKSIVINSRNVSIDIDIDTRKGDIYLVPSLWEEGRTGSFYLDIFCKYDLEIKELPFEYCKIQEKKEDMNCLICRKNVDLFKNKITFKQCKWHTSCYKCTICNKSLENNFYDINKLYDNNYGGFCEKCYKEKYNEKCYECGSIIDGKYYDIKGKKVHEKCYQNYLIKISDKCNYCNEAILNIPNKFSGHYYNISNKKIHKECYNDYINSIAEKCIICQENIVGSYYNTKKGKLHKKCYNTYLEKNAPECIICKKKIIKQRYYRLNKTKAIHIDCYNRYYK